MSLSYDRERFRSAGFSSPSEGLPGLPGPRASGLSAGTSNASGVHSSACAIAAIAFNVGLNGRRPSSFVM